MVQYWQAHTRLTWPRLLLFRPPPPLSCTRMTQYEVKWKTTGVAPFQLRRVATPKPFDHLRNINSEQKGIPSFLKKAKKKKKTEKQKKQCMDRWLTEWMKNSNNNKHIRGLSQSVTMHYASHYLKHVSAILIHYHYILPFLPPLLYFLFFSWNSWKIPNYS